MMDFRDNLQKCQEYIHALEEERIKIQVFQRELPLCLDLVTQAIEACKQQLSWTTTPDCFNGHSECSEQTTSDGPVLEEFIPLKRSNSTDDDDELESNEAEINNAQTNIINNIISNNDKSGKKADWLSSVQLWNQTPDLPTTQEEHQPKRVPVVEVKKNGGAFHPFHKEKSTTSNVNKHTSAPAASSCSSAEAAVGARGDGGSKKEEKGGQSQRKSRRCWSPELHKRFLHALQQLGGSHVGTPKQIRELMKVDGLTNDEVKSHLQKYRLHTRRPNTTIHNDNNPQTPQFVVVGGIWMPPPEYASVAATTTTTTTIPVSAPDGNVYAPVAAIATPKTSTTIVMQSRQREQKQSNQSQCEERGNPSSPSTSSSTHTITTPCHDY